MTSRLRISHMRLKHGHWKRGDRRGVPITVLHILLEGPGYGAEYQTFHLHGELTRLRRNMPNAVAFLHGAALTAPFHCLPLPHCIFIVIL